MAGREVSKQPYKSFRERILEVANRTVIFNDFTGSLPLNIPLDIEPSRAEKRVGAMIEEALKSGQMVVFNIDNGGLDKSIVGLQRVSGSTQVHTSVRYPVQSFYDESGKRYEVVRPPREFVLKKPTVDISFDQEGEVYFNISEKGKDFPESTLNFAVPGRMQAGQHFEIVSVDSASFGRTLLVASGLTDSPWTYTQPSSWFIKGSNTSSPVFEKTV